MKSAHVYFQFFEDCMPCHVMLCYDIYYYYYYCYYDDYYYARHAAAATPQIPSSTVNWKPTGQHVSNYG